MTTAGKTIRTVSKQVYYLTVAVCFIFLLVLLAAVWLSNAVAERKDEAAQWLSQQVAYPVTIGEAELYFLDVFPKLHLRNVHILDTQKSVAVMSVNHIFLDIDLLASIKQKQPVLNSMSLDQASVQIKRAAAGEISIRGLENILAQQSESTSEEFNLPVQAVNVKQLAVNFVDDKQPILSGNYKLDSANLSLQDQTQLYVQANAVLPRHLGQSLLFNGSFQFKVDTFKLEQWQGQVSATNLSVTSWSSLGQFEQFEVTRGIATVNLKLAENRNDEEKFEAKGRVELSDVAIHSKQDQLQDALVINQLKSPVNLLWTPQQWSLKTESLSLSVGQQTWPETRLELVSGADHYQLKMDYLNLANLTELAKKLSNDEQLIALQPSGEINDFELDYSSKTGLKSLSAKLNNVAINSTKTMPGIAGVTAQLDWSEHAGYVIFDSENITIDAGTKLPQLVSLESVKGKAELQQSENQWLLETSDFQIKNDDFNVTINGTVTHTEQATVPDMQIDLEDIQVTKWKNYVPLEILSDDFREWSDQAFRAGDITKGTIALKGDLAEFPFLKPEQNGEFKMELAVTGMQLDYGVGWPHLYDVDGSILGDGKLLTIRSEHGRIADFAFNKLQTDIDNYLVSKPVLTTKGRVDGTTQKALDFLKSSPLQDRFGQIATNFSATGSTSIILDLTVPLTSVNSATANGSISFNNSQLISNDDIDIQLDKVNGVLLFDGDGVTGDKLAAEFLEQPISIDVLPAKGSTVIEVTGQMPVTKLYQKWPELKADFISGKTPFKTTLSVTEQQLGIFELDVNVTSDLEGVTVDMPAPFGKSPAEQRELTVQIHEHKKETLAYRVNYADLLNTYLLANDEQIQGEIRLGSGKAKLAESGLSLKGQLGQLDLATWQNWQNNQSSQEGNGFLDSLDIVSLNIDQLTAVSQSITNIAVIAEKAAQDWRINLHSDQIKGRASIPLLEQKALPIAIDLDYLYLKTSDRETIESETTKATALWPTIQFQTKQLQIDKMKLGAVSFSSRQLATKWVMDRLTIDSNSYKAEGNGVWELTDALNQTQFKLKANTDDLKAVLADFGYQQAIEAKGSQFDVELSWSGGPADLSLASLNGTSKFKVGTGKLVDVEPGAAGRIFGLMSITAIPRRLTLDFSDLFSKGFNFSSITGEFDLNDGIAKTSNLVMAGDSARIEVKGPIDIVNKRYNQSVKVTPNVSSTLPVAGAVAGGPVGLGVGAAILLVDKIAGNLFGKDIVNLVSYNFRLTGPWSEPELTTLQAVTN